MVDASVIKNTEELLRSIGIPSQPAVLLEIQEQVNSDDPNFSVIAGLVKKDIGISARVIKVANSPLFGAGRVESIEQALNILGITRLFNIVLSSSLKKALTNKNNVDMNFLEQFWAHTEVTAKVTAYIARKTRSSSFGHAYMAGLFHDCGIPFLIDKFKDYFKVLKLAYKTNYPVVDIEDAVYKTNHCIASYIIAKSWKLPDPVAHSILYHHNPDVDIYRDGQAKKLASALILAETLHPAGTMKSKKWNFEIEPLWSFDIENSLTGAVDLNNDIRWQRVFSELGLDIEETQALHEDVLEVLNTLNEV
ncbi:signal transduction protein [Candidatus Magnetoovum chiemensis]|nr:signal transduction protein [Candidatus Magnetoovum chiemensis]